MAETVFFESDDIRVTNMSVATSSNVFAMRQVSSFTFIVEKNLKITESIPVFVGLVMAGSQFIIFWQILFGSNEWFGWGEFALRVLLIPLSIILIKLGFVWRNSVKSKHTLLLTISSVPTEVFETKDRRKATEISQALDLAISTGPY